MTNFTTITGAVNQLLQMIHSSHDALVHHASRALAQIGKSAALARRLCDTQLKLSVTNLIQVRIISKRFFIYFSRISSWFFQKQLIDRDAYAG